MSEGFDTPRRNTDVETASDFQKENADTDDANAENIDPAELQTRKDKAQAEEQAEKTEAEKRLGIQGLSNIHELIENANVSFEQKQSWKKLATLDIPNDATVKIVALMGDADFDQTNELPLMKEAFVKHCKNVSIVRIDNTLPKEEKMSMLEKELADPTADIIIPFFSSHGITKSHVKITEKNAPDDEFIVLSGNSADKESMSETAKKLAEKYAKDLIDPMTETVKSPQRGAAFSFEGMTVTASELIKQQSKKQKYADSFKKQPMDQPSEATKKAIAFTPPEETLTELFHLCLFEQPQNWEKVGISTKEFSELQKNAIARLPKGKSQNWIYILDNCYSGSATNDKIMELDTTKAILASSSEAQTSGHGDLLKSGIFTKRLFEFMKDGSPLGEAFIRADMLCNQDEEYNQNPKAAIRIDGKVIEVTSIEDQKEEVTV